MGWSLVKIGEVCDVIAGQSPEGKYYNTHSDGLPFYQGKKEFGDKFISQPSSWTSKVTKVAIAGDILMSVRAPVGPINFSTQKCCIGRGLAAIRASDRVNRDFLFYSLLSKQDVIKGNEGAVFSSINKTQIGQLEIPLPPIPEQQLIVSILDQAFADIEKARANAEKNLKNARELFDSYLNQVFRQRGEGWVEETLGQATGGVYTGPFGSLLHKSDYIVNGIPLINPAHITETGITADENKSVSLEVAERLSSYLMQEGDIVIGRRGEMGRCALVTEKEDGFLCGTGSFFIKSSNRCYGEYLVHFLRSASCKARLESIAGGAVMPNLSNKDLSSFTLYLPSYDIQKELAAEIDLVAKRTRNVAAVYEKKLASLDELKKSLLHKAFSGELTKTVGHAA